LVPGLAGLMPAGTPLAGLLPSAGAATPAAAPAAPATPGAPALPNPSDAAQSIVPMFVPLSGLP
ncbi:hypothetical protein, partial [Mycolicibacterium bacteremicum]|uniref:hypothetical protein n=1 Tax=Mycolicibacterium bacteremicum TaxID=564198 RepID=UPI0026EB02F0